MIVVYPMIVDDTVSPLIVPGVCKALERFALVYHMDNIYKWGGLPRDTRIISAGHSMLGLIARGANIPALGSMAESENILEAHKDKIDIRQLQPGGWRPPAPNILRTHPYGGGGGGGGRRSSSVPWATDDPPMFSNSSNIDPGDWINSAAKDILRQGVGLAGDYFGGKIKAGIEHPYQSAEAEKRRKHEDEMERRRRIWDFKSDRTVDYRPGELRTAISVEPTWVAVTNHKGSSIIGVKVIPYSVNGENLVKRAVLDTNLKTFDRFLEKYERGVTKIFYSIIRKFGNLPLISKFNISGDPLKDIIYARTKYAKNMYVMMNAATLHENDFILDMGGVTKLFNMGWGSAIVADDIAKRVFFCMQEFHGLCSSVDYAFVYESQSSRPDYGKIYKELEDLKKSTSPFFMKKVAMKRVLGEAKAFEHIEKFSDLTHKDDNFRGLGIPCLENSGGCK